MNYKTIHRHQSHVLVLSTLLAMSMGSCGGCDKGPAYDRPPVYQLGEFVFVIRKQEVMWMLEVEVEGGVCSEGPEDFDWEGYRYRVQQGTDEKGVRHIEVKGLRNHIPFRYVSQTQPDGTKTILYDANGDGRTDKRAEKRPASHTYVLEMDTNGDGVFDERITETFDIENDKQHSVFEKRKFGLFWKKTREETYSVARIIVCCDRHE